MSGGAARPKVVVQRRCISNAMLSLTRATPEPSQIQVRGNLFSAVEGFEAMRLDILAMVVSRIVFP